MAIAAAKGRLIAVIGDEVFKHISSQMGHFFLPL